MKKKKCFSFCLDCIFVFNQSSSAKTSMVPYSSTGTIVGTTYFLKTDRQMSFRQYENTNNENNTLEYYQYYYLLLPLFYNLPQTTINYYNTYRYGTYNFYKSKRMRNFNFFSNNSNTRALRYVISNTTQVGYLQYTLLVQSVYPWYSISTSNFYCIVLP